VLWERTLAAPDLVTFEKEIVGQEVMDIARRGKFLILELSEYSLLFHLRMSGDIFQRQNQADVTHPRLIIWFYDDGCLIFNDPRKFGRVWLLEDP
jgi:formamidopyrimidine-DNA glycosylase